MENNPCERLVKYVTNFKNSMKSLKVLDSSASKVVSLAVDYMKDSQYYLERGGCITGLVTISYAEGLLDALRMMQAIEWKWSRSGDTVVFAAGSFDILHPGHIEFLKWASSLGNKLVVIVSRDSNYRRFKGFNPIFSEDERVKLVESIRYVYRAFIGSDKDIFDSVINVKPSIIALGYDQPQPEYIISELKSRGIDDVVVVRIPKKIGEYSSSMIKSKICSEWCAQQYEYV
ncbi:MAG: DUF357 domain-containing protein [Ignisphaera sp.]